MLTSHPVQKQAATKRLLGGAAIRCVVAHCCANSNALLQGRYGSTAGDRRCHYVFNAKGGVGLVSAVAVDVAEVRQRNLPLSRLSFLGPNHGSAALPWSFVPTAVVRFRAPAALGAVLNSAVFAEESESGLLPQSLCGGKDHSFEEGRLPAAPAAGRGHACSCAVAAAVAAAAAAAAAAAWCTPGFVV